MARVPRAATSLSFRDPGGRHRRGVDFVYVRGKIRGGDPRRTTRGRSSWFARGKIVASRVMTGLPVAMLAKGATIPGDSAAATGLQSGPAAIPTALENK